MAARTWVLCCLMDLTGERGQMIQGRNDVAWDERETRTKRISRTSVREVNGNTIWMQSKNRSNYCGKCPLILLYNSRAACFKPFSTYLLPIFFSLDKPFIHFPCFSLPERLWKPFKSCFQSWLGVRMLHNTKSSTFDLFQFHLSDVALRNFMAVKKKMQVPHT